MVERNYNLIELGPKETGKSFVFREISPYAMLLSGGQGSVTDLFGWKNRKDKPGLVVKYDLVAFDEVAGPNFKSANDKDMYKGYMEQGSFSRGDDKGTISAEAASSSTATPTATSRRWSRPAICSNHCPKRFGMTTPFMTAGTRICPAGRCRS